MAGMPLNVARWIKGNHVSIEKRLAPRIEVSIGASLTGPDGRKGQGRIYDISTGGVGLLSRIGLRSGDLFTIRFTLDIKGEMHVLETTAEARFSTLLGNSGESRVGVRFVDLPSSMFEIITRYISSVGDQRRKEQLQKAISGDSWIERLFTGSTGPRANDAVRKEPRVKINRKVILKSENGETIVGQSVDISENGLGLLVTTSLASGDHYKMFFYLTPDRKHGLIQGLAEVRFCRPQGDGEQRIAGLQFVSFVGNSRELLHEFLEQRLGELFEQGQLLFRAALSGSQGKGNPVGGKASTNTEEKFVICPMGSGCGNSLLGESAGKVVHVCAMTKTCLAFQSRTG
jgi:c-di-GMP-binding flagellar brake protein YcgR